jgi:threonine dehydratase
MPEILQEILKAEHRIRPYVRETPLIHAFSLSQLTGCDVYLKLETIQHTGSFKVRGALNTMLAFTPAQREKGVVAASTGNHGAAVAFAAHTLGLCALVFVPEGASEAKVARIRTLGAEVQVHGSDCVDAEAHARGYAKARAMTYISPYNDARVIGGQGTIGVEIARQQPKIDAVFASLGGGGLISGIATYLKAVNDDIRIIAASPQNSCVMVASVEAGRILDKASQPTLSDGTAGGIEPGAITFDLCHALVDDYVLIAEDEIREALRLMLKTQPMLIEGASAVAVAALLKRQAQFQAQRVVVVLCGANIGVETLRGVLCE